MFTIEGLILNALQKKKIFIGTMMLCRYLNGKGYIRYGCNAGYPEDNTHGNARLNPCPILCKDSKIYPGRIRYWVMKLSKEKKLFTIKKKFIDSKNPNSKNAPMKTDVFRFVCESEEIFKAFWKKNTLEAFL